MGLAPGAQSEVTGGQHTREDGSRQAQPSEGVSAAAQGGWRGRAPVQGQRRLGWRSAACLLFHRYGACGGGV